MIELLILFELSKKVLTMYGISKEIKKEFSVLTIPSYGTIKPALLRLERNGCIKSQKTMSEGGRPSVFYSITLKGEDEIKNLLLQQPLENPINFLTSARIKLVCASLLNSEEKKELFKLLKTKCELIMYETKNILNNKADFYYTMVFDNLICEYKNLISLLEAFERAGNN